MLRNIFSVIMGIIVAAVTIMIVEGLGQFVYPIPPGLDLTNIALIKIIMPFIPVGVFLFIALSWLLGSFLGSIVTSKIALNENVHYGYITGGILLTAAIITMFVLPYPFWFLFLGIIVFVSGTWLGTRVGIKKA